MNDQVAEIKAGREKDETLMAIGKDCGESASTIMDQLKVCSGK